MNLKLIADIATASKVLGCDIGALLPLMQFKDLKVADINTDVVKIVAGVMGIEISPDNALVQRVIELLRVDDVDAVADLISRPETIGKLKLLLQGEEMDWNLIFCPHCKNAINP